MAFPTASDIALLEAAIRAAITDGSWQVQTIQFSDQAVTFRSLNEALEFLKSLNTMSLGGSVTRYAATSKGV